jgi:PadR family transcriptional regulator, regulatory protein PadR
MRGTEPNVAAFLPLKPLETGVLLVLAEREDYGYGIVKRLAEASAGAIRLAPSNLYYVLDRMLTAGLVAERAERTDARASAEAARRGAYYQITPLGRATLAAEARRLTMVVDTARRLRLLPQHES